VKVISFIEAKVKLRQTKDTIKTAVEGFCLILGPLTNSCVSLVEENFDRIYDLALLGLNPRSICGRLHTCVVKDDADDQDEEENDDSIGSVQCNVCEKVMTFIKNGANHQTKVI
jgi:hypothetical protein